MRLTIRNVEWESYGAVIEEDALEFLADMAGGDARKRLNAIELGILTHTPVIQTVRSI